MIQKALLKLLTALPIHNNDFIKTKIRTYGEKIISNFDYQGVFDDKVKCKCYLIVTIYSLSNYNKKTSYFQVC